MIIAYVLEILTILGILYFCKLPQNRVAFIAVSIVVTLIGTYVMMFHGASSDYEVWNGTVSNKQAIKRSCPTGWNSSKDNFCTNYTTRSVYVGRICTGSGKDEICVNQYDTEYSYKYSWERRYFIVSKDINAEWEIDRIDRQGVNYPPVFAQTSIGDPVSKTNLYQNWVRASADSLFHKDGEIEDKYKGSIPEYPLEIFDYFKINRIVTVGFNLEDKQLYERKLSDALKVLGPKRQMNAVIVIVDASKFQDDYPYAVRRAWKGFKKNDAVVFIGVNPDKTIAWSDTMSWSKNSAFDISMRDLILENKNKPLDMDKVIADISNKGMTEYERRSMKEFEYLKSEIPTPWSIIFIMFGLNAILLVVASRTN